MTDKQRRISMTHKQRRILEVLATQKTEMYGLDIVKAGAASRMSLYIELARLEDQGLIEGREEPPNEATIVARRLYRITPAGATKLLPAARVMTS